MFFKLLSLLSMLIVCMASNCHSDGSNPSSPDSQDITKKKTFTSNELIDALRKAKTVEEFDELERRVRAGDCSKCDTGPDFWITHWIRPEKEAFLKNQRDEANKADEAIRETIKNPNTTITELDQLDQHRVKEMGLLKPLQERKLKIIETIATRESKTIQYDFRMGEQHSNHLPHAHNIEHSIVKLRILGKRLNDDEKWSEISHDRLKSAKNLIGTEIHSGENKLLLLRTKKTSP